MGLTAEVRAGNVRFTDSARKWRWADSFATIMTPAEFYIDLFGKPPERILMLKGDSAGIGDILRSSAAWRALKNVFPKTELHLALFTWEPSYASISLIARHHLLQSFRAVDKRICVWRAWPRFWAWANDTAQAVKPDLVIDFETAGVYSAMAAWRLSAASGAVTLGIGEYPPRGAFFDVASVSKAEFARQRGLEFPLEYCYRDFVSLSALKIERNGIGIELEETDEGRIFRESMRERFRIPPDARMIGLNIGCGTPDAKGRRPDLKLLCALVQELQKMHGAVVVLTGAKFEADVNQEFIGLWPANGRSCLFDLAGETSLLQLTGLIRACDLFISTDSGPYHMGVALKVPSLAIFRGRNRVHFHHEKNVRCVVLTKEQHIAPLVQAAAELLPPPSGFAEVAGLRAPAA
jgi:ADP-heptose:LPS heptosyltransferase